MKRFFIIAIIAALAGPSLRGQSGTDLFQKALSKERGEGQLEEAIQIYERIVKEFPTDRALAARSLVQLGRCYDKLGKAEAKTAEPAAVRPRRRSSCDRSLMGASASSSLDSNTSIVPDGRGTTEPSSFKAPACVGRPACSRLTSIPVASSR